MSPALAAAVTGLVVAPLLATGPASAAARPVDDACPADRVVEDRFSDVPPDNVHEAAVDCLVWWEVAAGRTVTSYAPGEAVTRGQLATLLGNLVVASGGDLPAPPTGNRFPDDDGSPHEYRTEQLAEAGIVQGQPNGEYGTGLPVTRAQMASLLVRAFDHRIPGDLPPGPDAFRDDDGSVHESAIDRAAAAGFTTGVGPGRYAPQAPVRRDQMATFLVRALDALVEDGVSELPEPTPGDLEPAFGDDGVATVPFGEGYAEARSVAVDAAGRVVLTGDRPDGFGATRLLPDGTLDAGFGRDGRAVAAFGAGTLTGALAGAVTGEGAVVAVGTVSEEGRFEGADLGVARWTPDGVLDGSFGGDGTVTTSFPGATAIADAAVVQPDGRLLVAATLSHDDESQGVDVAVTRYAQDGTLDRSFGSGGVVVLEVGPGDHYAGGLALHPDGGVLVGGLLVGTAPDERSSADFTLTRLAPGGQRDAGFAESGVALVDVGGQFQDMGDVAVGPEGAVVATGRLGRAGTSSEVVVVRWTADGALDRSFGDEGVVTSAPAPWSEGHAVLVQPDGRVVVTGRANDNRPNEPTWTWLLLRYTADGALDPSFGRGGVVRTPVGQQAHAVALAPDGDLLVAGCDCPAPPARPEGAPESSFVVGRYVG